MFAPNTAQSIETSAEYRRAEVERWAADERLARSVARPNGGSRPSWLSALAALLAAPLRRRGATALESPTDRPHDGAAPIRLVPPARPVEAASEDDLLSEGDRGLAAA
jgi:hypothetical protein